MKASVIAFMIALAFLGVFGIGYGLWYVAFKFGIAWAIGAFLAIVVVVSFCATYRWGD